MKVAIKEGKHNIRIFVPMWMGSLGIRFIPKKRISKEQKQFILQTFKACTKCLKAYKGLCIVNIELVSGTHIRITV